MSLILCHSALYNSARDPSLCVLCQDLPPFCVDIFHFVLTIHLLFIYYSINGHLGLHPCLGFCEYVLNMAVQIPPGVSVSVLSCMPRSGMAESDDNSALDLLPQHCSHTDLSIPQSAQGLQFLHTPHQCLFSVFNFFFLILGPCNGQG